jgi:hypothetical protein
LKPRTPASAIIGTASINLIEQPHLGLRNSVDRDLLHNRELYEEALAHYFARSFWEARHVFDQVVENCLSDKAALLMMRRCDHMLSLKLPSDWDGVFVHNDLDQWLCPLPPSLWTKVLLPMT